MISPRKTFDQNYQRHLNHLHLKGYRPKTVDAYARAIRRVGKYFDYEINDLAEEQLLPYMTTGRLGITVSASWG